jgi:hypothetical protein
VVVVLSRGKPLVMGAALGIPRVHTCILKFVTREDLSTLGMYYLHPDKGDHNVQGNSNTRN